MKIEVKVTSVSKQAKTAFSSYMGRRCEKSLIVGDPTCDLHSTVYGTCGRRISTIAKAPPSSTPQNCNVVRCGFPALRGHTRLRAPPPHPPGSLQPGPSDQQVTMLAQ